MKLEQKHQHKVGSRVQLSLLQVQYCSSRIFFCDFFFYSKVAEILQISIREIQGHPATLFCKITDRRSKYCVEISKACEKLKLSG